MILETYTDVGNCKSIYTEICLHWMKHKAVQYFHTTAFFSSLVQIYCCFVLEALVEKVCEQGNQTKQHVLLRACCL